MYDSTVGWNETPDWNRQWRETDDPRLIEVIERDGNAQPPDGDVYAPAYWVEYRGEWSSSRAGFTFDDDEVVYALLTAWNRWGFRNQGIAERYLRIFYGSAFVTLNGPSQGDTLVILDTPAHREHISADAERELTMPTDEWLSGDVSTWRAHIEGDVWGAGYATLEGRVTTETPIDGDNLEDQGWVIEVETWGYAGTEWAREAAANEVQPPALDPLLPV